jgi:hypothetical protein
MIIAICCTAAFPVIAGFLLYAGRFGRRGIVWTRDE